MNEEFNREQSTKTNNEKNTFSMLISGVAGGLIAALFTGGIFLTQLDDSQDTASHTPEDTEQTTEEEVVPTTNLSTNNTNSISGAVEKVSDAVVGISNVQQVSLWEEANAAGTGSGVVYKKDGEYAMWSQIITWSKVRNR
ncbi:serine protease [Gracilibacillus boraciitolerans JCM 21714]|uniref:Serine protease n=1 Tax=Gracilibacillus boraciitolerans JCM 21714 TaxID=1298598 RepID=W4VJZ7_9BACI|nr:hypothetical protein [Gracilibacillus boraciitolerans]GAE93527.1 serine protease [Gracilibacillus boraciitolerans JCM 21714]